MKKSIIYKHIGIKSDNLNQALLTNFSKEEEIKIMNELVEFIKEKDTNDIATVIYNIIDKIYSISFNALSIDDYVTILLTSSTFMKKVNKDTANIIRDITGEEELISNNMPKSNKETHIVIDNNLIVSSIVANNDTDLMLSEKMIEYVFKMNKKDIEEKKSAYNFIHMREQANPFTSTRASLVYEITKDKDNDRESLLDIYNIDVKTIKSLFKL